MLTLVASLEATPNIPGRAITEAAREQNLFVPQASAVSEPPGQGLSGTVDGHLVQITSRKQLIKQNPDNLSRVTTGSRRFGMYRCYRRQIAAALRFRDAPRRRAVLLSDISVLSMTSSAS